MPTAKQRKLAKLIVKNMATDKPETGGALLEKVGYGPGLQKQPGRVIESAGVQEALEEYGFSEDNAKMVVAEIMLNGDNDPNARLKATDQVFKLKGSYAPEKRVNVNVDVSTEAREKSKNAISEFLGKSD